MKKYLLAVALLISGLGAWAQDEMKTVWETKIDHKSDMGSGFSSTGRNFTYAYSDKEISFLDNNTGKLIWNKKFKEISPNISKVDEVVPLWESGMLFLFDRKMGKDQIVCIDFGDGRMLWSTPKYQDITEESIIYIKEKNAFALSLKESLVMIDARSGKELWSTSRFKGAVAHYIATNDNHLVMLNYKPDLLAALFKGFKNQLVKINLNNGDVVWDATYVGMAQKKVYTGEAVLDLYLKGNKVFLAMNGLQVYDYASGAKSWSAAYDIDLSDVVKKPFNAKRFGVYNAVAEPLVEGNYVYLIDMQGKKSQYLKKFDMNTGAVVWTSPELKDVRVAPNLFHQDGKLVMQIGGAVEAQAYIVERRNNPDGSVTTTQTWKKWFPNVKPFGLQTFDANTGKLVWEAEKFRKGITNSYVEGNNVFVCSGKSLYSYDLHSGKEHYEKPLADDNIGLAMKIFPYKDRVTIIGEKGISQHSMDGKLLHSGKWKKSEMDALKGSKLLMRSEKDDIACFDLETCKYLEYNARKDATSYLSESGEFIVVVENRKISRLATQ